MRDLSQAQPTPAPTLAAAPAPPALPETTYALGVLSERIGPADPELLPQLLAGTSSADLVTLGATISSQRIVTDTTRIYNLVHDYWQRATPEKRRRVRGFSSPLLALAVDQAHRLEEMMGRHKTKKAADGTARAMLDTALQTARATGLDLRDQAASALLDAAGQTPVLRQEVTTSIGRADTPEALALGLSSLAQILRRWIQREDPALRTRLNLASLDDDYAAELDQAAQHLLAAATAARLRPPPVTQGDLDRLEGINLLLLGQILRAFRHAHKLDPTIPCPSPIATRRAFNRHTAKKPKPAASPPEAAPPSPPPAQVRPDEPHLHHPPTHQSERPPQPPAPPSAAPSAGTGRRGPRRLYIIYPPREGERERATVGSLSLGVQGAPPPVVQRSLEGPPSLDTQSMARIMPVRRSIFADCPMPQPPATKDLAARTPPGQTLTTKWPVLHYSGVPKLRLEDFELRTEGDVERPLRLTWKDLQALPRLVLTSDFHCVTTWSRLDNTWEGISFRALAELTGVKPSAKHVMAHSYDGYYTNVELSWLMDDDVMITWAHDGKPLTPEHGGPVRLVVPKLYAWKSAKWLHKLEFMPQDRRGFWEERGYHNRGEPFAEERYSYQETE